MGITASTWDPNNKGASVTLSGGNLTATVSSGTGSVAATNKIGGLTYCEWTVGATLTGSCRLGVCNPSFTKTGLLGVDNNGVGYDSGGTVKINNATVATIAAFAASDNVSAAIDPLLKLIWFRVNGGNWNNDVIANQNPVGAVGGISISALSGGLAPAWGGTATASATGVFASGSWTYTAPTGFLSPDTLGSSVVNGAVASRSASFTQYGRAHGLGYGSTGNQTSSPQAYRGAVKAGAWYGNQRLWSPAATATTVSGQVRQSGVAVAGKTVLLYDTVTGFLLGTATSDGSGNWSIPALGRTSVFAVCLDPTYQAIVYDQLTPV